MWMPGFARRADGAEITERTPSVRWALAGLSLSMLLSSLGTSIANVGLPTFAHVFSASFQQVQWIVLAYLLAITTLIVTAGRLGDIIGRRRLLLVGIAAFTGASALCALAPTLWLLIAARAAQGLGAAIMLALTMAFVGETVPQGRAGRAMGLLGTMSAVGTALGPSLGGVLIAALDWRALFLVNVPMGVLASVLAYRHLPAGRSHPRTAGIGVDTVGTLLLALTLAAYTLAMTLGRGGFGALNVALLVAAGVGAVLFLLTETKVASPLIPLAMFQDRALNAGLVTSGLVSAVMMATLVVGPFYLSLARGLNAASVGFALSVGPLVAALVGIPAGRSTDRFGAHRLITVGLVGMLSGCAMLAALPTALGTLGYIGPIVVVTAGYALFQTANNTAVMTDIRPEQRGVISGALNLSRNLGLITGASALGAVFALASGTSDVTTAVPGAVETGMRVTFVVEGILIVVALVIALAGRRSPRSARLAPLVERVEDEVEAVFERGLEVVTDLGDVPGDDLGQIGELVGQRRHLPLVRTVGELLHLRLSHRRALLRGFERDAFLLKGKAIDVGVLHGVGLDGHLDREPGFAEASKNGVVKPQAGRPGRGARLHQAHGPAMTVQHIAGRQRPPAHRGLPVDIGRGQLDLTENDVDHAVEEFLLVGHVVVQGHRAGPEPIGEFPHRQRLEPVTDGEFDGGVQHPLPAQRDSYLCCLLPSGHGTTTPPPCVLVHRTTRVVRTAYDTI
jgi:EmrB/QacA subfamily drug resistance transporter